MAAASIWLQGCCKVYRHRTLDLVLAAASAASLAAGTGFGLFHFDGKRLLECGWFGCGQGVTAESPQTVKMLTGCVIFAVGLLVPAMCCQMRAVSRASDESDLHPIPSDGQARRLEDTSSLLALSTRSLAPSRFRSDSGQGEGWLGVRIVGGSS
eukprot:TRINITY_DN4164_c0_g1_i5.p3 TRINITY_DN4164_c0_g1~~TRINITY_DN4164_c0_g1_i5.p3  ORF type:complete len:154 (+),score=26.81 TRINITY_DN4164_c0_g1_i5:408-869(+)